MHHGRNGIDNIKINVLCFMMACKHANKATNATAQYCHQEQRFFWDTPSILDRTCLIHRHCGIQRDIQHQIIQHQHP